MTESFRFISLDVSSLSFQLSASHGRLPDSWLVAYCYWSVAAGEIQRVLPSPNLKPLLFYIFFAVTHLFVVTT